MAGMAWVIGCGYMGSQVARRLVARGDAVTVTSTREVRVSELASEFSSALRLDVNDPSTWAALDALEPGAEVYCLVTPSNVDAQQFRSFAERLAARAPRVMVLTSSTFVYGASERVVTAESEVEIGDDRGRRQYALEEAWRDAGAIARVVRLAGIYGPERLIGKRWVEEGAEIPGNPDGFLNLIYVDDGAALLIAVAGSVEARPVEIGCDSAPVRRRDYYGELAQRLGAPAPAFAGSANSGLGRRCESLTTQQRTGWTPAVGDYRAGFTAAGLGR